MLDSNVNPICRQCINPLEKGIHTCELALPHAAYLAGMPTNGANVPLAKLSNRGTGAAMHADSRKLGSKRPSAIAVAFAKAGLDWRKDFAEAIKANKRERIKLWLKLLPYLVTSTSDKLRVKKWRGKASKAALVALEALEQE